MLKKYIAILSLLFVSGCTLTTSNNAENANSANINNACQAYEQHLQCLHNHVPAEVSESLYATYFKQMKRRESQGASINEFCQTTLQQYQNNPIYNQYGCFQ